MTSTAHEDQFAPEPLTVEDRSMSMECTRRSREAHEDREASIDAFLDLYDLPPGARITLYEIIEKDRIWCRLVNIEICARELVRLGS
jgi:hypothetical protein